MTDHQAALEYYRYVADSDGGLAACVARQGPGLLGGAIVVVVGLICLWVLGRIIGGGR